MPRVKQANMTGATWTLLADARAAIVPGPYPSPCSRWAQRTVRSYISPQVTRTSSPPAVLPPPICVTCAGSALRNELSTSWPRLWFTFRVRGVLGPDQIRPIGS
uniref:Putative secreted protein n=1 Tax=Anopheles darlingi TaxID=43151 RepID=A0A2M4D790_ANODA